MKVLDFKKKKKDDEMPKELDDIQTAWKTLAILSDQDIIIMKHVRENTQTLKDATAGMSENMNSLAHLLVMQQDNISRMEKRILALEKDGDTEKSLL